MSDRLELLEEISAAVVDRKLKDKLEELEYRVFDAVRLHIEGKYADFIKESVITSIKEAFRQGCPCSSHKEVKTSG